MTDPASSIDRLAAMRGMVSPVPAYFPLDRAFCEEVARLAVAEARVEWARTVPPAARLVAEGRRLAPALAAEARRATLKGRAT